ncbi:hypothetical protein OAI94_00865 [bacterium]|nr:hypothetical protein [bacterium]
MKQILIFFLFLSLIGCSNIIKNKQTYIDFKCPKVFFSSEDRIYIDNSVSIDDILVKAELNNFSINKKCQQQGNIAVISLDILIIAKPMDNLEDSLLYFPIYISLLDDKNEILETQYFLVSGKLNENLETNILIETDITDQLQIVTKYLDTSQLVFGFMLSDKKRDLLN